MEMASDGDARAMTEIDDSTAGVRGSHPHIHGMPDASILRSRAGIRAVLISLGVLGATAALQAIIFVVTDSVALLSDLVHNVGDALTALPVGIALALRSERAEKWSGKAVVAAIFISACVAMVASIQRLVDPRPLDDLWVLAAAGAVGFIGNEVAAVIRKRTGRRIDSPALIADGEHARADGLVSLGVVLSAGVVAAGLEIADPIIGIAISLFILRITWHAWVTVR
jgi:cation diffusion facilitator family transporter